jgi:hypothetical protein
VLQLTYVQWNFDAVGKQKEELGQCYANHIHQFLLQSEVEMMHVEACLRCLAKNITYGSHLNCGAGRDDHHCGIEHPHLLDALLACLHEA